MASIEEWLEGEGLESLKDLFRIGEGWADARQTQEAIQDRAEVARYSRRLDLFNLAMHKQSLDLDQRINRRLATQGAMEVAQAQREVDLFNAESRLRASERDYATWLASSRIREIDRIGRRELGLAFAEHEAGLVQRRAAVAVVGARQAQLGVRRGTERMTREAGLRTTAAEYGEQAVGRGAVRARLGAGRRTLAAGRARIGAERAVVGRSGELRIQARREQAAQEIGAAAVGESTRGIRGSSRETAAMQARQDAKRDVELYQLEDGLRQIQLSEQAAKLEATGVDVEQRAAQEQARLGTATARTSERQAQLVAGGREAAAGFEVERAGLAGQAQRLEHQARVVDPARARLLGGRGEQLGEEQERLRRGELVQRAGYSLQEASANLRAGEAKIGKERAITSGDKATYDVWLGTTAQQINDWQLKNLPDLPDYEGMSARAAMSAIMRTAAEVID